MRVLLVCEEMAFGEIEHVVLNLSQTFIHDQNKFIRPCIAYLRSEKLTDKYLDQFAEDDIPICDLGYNGFPYVEVFSNLKKLIEQESIEIVVGIRMDIRIDIASQ